MLDVIILCIIAGILACIYGCPCCRQETNAATLAQGPALNVQPGIVEPGMHRRSNSNFVVKKIFLGAQVT